MKALSQKGRLRDTFVFLFVVIAACPVLLLGGVALYVLSATHRADVSRLEVAVLLEKSKIVESFVQNALGSLHIEAQSLSETGVSAGKGTSWQSTFATILLKENSSFREVSFADVQGNEVAKDARLSAVKSLLNVSQTQPFQAALAGQDYVGDVFYTLAGPVVTMAAPVLVNGKVFQIVMAQLDLSSLVSSLQDTQLEESRLLLFDHRGTYIATATTGSIRPGEDLSPWNRVQSVLGGEQFDGLGSGDRYESVFLGKPVVGAALSVGTTRWPLLIEWSLAKADAIIDRVRLEVLFITLASVAAVIFFAVLFANWLVSPIRTLEVAARKIAEGELEGDVNINVGNELDELGTSFNRMAQGLKRLDELRKEFVFVAAHELRAPVTAIKGYLSLIFEGEAGPVSESIQKLLAPVQESNNRLVNLINDLLEVARSEAGRLEVKTSPIDVSASVEAIMRQSASLADAKHITVEYKREATLPKVMGDAERVGEVIMNFISNAVKYTPEGGHVTISHEVADGFVMTHVVDDGLGMSEEDQKHLFEKFFRADAVKEQHIEGTGLGLFITKELVEKMGGNIKVQSAKGKGSTFSFGLKIAV